MQASSPAWTAEDAIAHLRALASEENRAGMARFGINTAAALGVGNAVLRQLARKMKRDHARALERQAAYARRGYWPRLPTNLRR